MSQHPLLISRSQLFVQNYGAGSGSSRSVSGNLDFYQELEAKLASALGKQSALILGTGFQTNSTVLSALLDPTILGAEPLIFCDKYCHASMLQGANHVIRFKHNDLNHLVGLLEKYAECSQPKFILVESVYSMEGDQADLAQLIHIKQKYNAFLYVDDAHAVGVYGWGKAVQYAPNIDLIMGTFSKALGSFGAYVACSLELRDYLINRCKGLIYSTALPPAVLGAISAAIDLVPQLEPARKRLFQFSRALRECLDSEGLSYGQSTTHIVPWIIGDAKQTVKLSEKFEKAGIIACPIRPPSVSPHTSRIRFCVTSAHSEEELEKLMHEIKNNKLF